ncbi:ccnyl1 [Symbiodinium microadriaticum]|nr:ccnyl1 [Symbiodinium microadriaticum]
MGAKPSRGLSSQELKQPLLPLTIHCPAFKPDAGSWLSTQPPRSGGSLPSAPASFKAGKPRKTRDFIDGEITLNSTGTRHVWDGESLDPRFVTEEQTTHAISGQVATLVCRYVEEGRDKAEALTKNDDEFHEDHFLRRRWCCCPRRKKKPDLSHEAVLTFLNDISDSLYFCKQVVVLCAIYIERLIEQTDTVLTVGNWRSLVTAGLLIASKVWEDIHPWNADFEDCLLEVAGIRYKCGALYRLESMFLEKLQWKVFVDAKIYAAYFFSLMEGIRQNRSQKIRQRAQRPRHHSDFGPIKEDEHFGETDSELDLERGLMSPEQRGTSERSSSSLSSASPDVRGRDEVESCLSGESLHSARDCWRLDAGNPHIGSLRHAPRALAPSRHIPQSEELLRVHKLVSRTTSMFGLPKGRHPEALTLSGATGSQLKTELLQYLKKRGEELAVTLVRGQTILPASDALAAVRGMEHSIVWVDSREGQKYGGENQVVERDVDLHFAWAWAIAATVAARLFDKIRVQYTPKKAEKRSMNVVRPKDVPRGKIACEKDYQQALLASDIRGAVPSFMTQSLHVEGPPHKDFIKGSVARSSYPSIEKQQDLSLTTHDVDGAQPKAKVFKTTRQTNPLTPRYTLQSAPMDVPPPNSTRTHELLQRDTMSFKGTSSSRIPMRDYTHNPAEGHDVEMSQPNIRNRVNVTTPRETLRTLERSGERILSGKYVSTGNSSMAPDYKVQDPDFERNRWMPVSAIAEPLCLSAASQIAPAAV